MLQFVYGSYKHVVGEVDVSRSLEIIRSPRTGLPTGVKHNWSLRGTLLGNGVSSIDVAVLKLKTAYAQNVAYCGMLDTVSGPVKSFWIASPDTLNGIRVVRGPSFPSGSEVQHVTQYDYQIELEAVVPAVSDDLSQFQESLSFSGGGSTYGHLEPLYGVPVKVLLKQNTVFRVVQSGRAVGWLSQPNVPAPIWPSALTRAPNIRPGSPRLDNGVLVDWPIEWSYEFESSTKLIGKPNY